MMLSLFFSMEGGELFDRIQDKGHFTERGGSIVWWPLCTLGIIII